MTALEELVALARADPEGGKYKLVLYKEDGMCWVRRGECAVPNAPKRQQYECNACNWKGKLDDTVMLGSVGPLCPECRETTDKCG